MGPCTGPNWIGSWGHNQHKHILKRVQVPYIPIGLQSAVSCESVGDPSKIFQGFSTTPCYAIGNQGIKRRAYFLEIILLLVTYYKRC